MRSDICRAYRPRRRAARNSRPPDFSNTQRSPSGPRSDPGSAAQRRDRSQGHGTHVRRRTRPCGTAGRAAAPRRARVQPWRSRRAGLTARSRMGRHWDLRTSARSGQARGARLRRVRGRSRIERRQIVEIVTVNTLDPEAVRLRCARIPHTHTHGTSPCRITIKPRVALSARSRKRTVPRIQRPDRTLLAPARAFEPLRLGSALRLTASAAWPAQWRLRQAAACYRPERPGLRRTNQQAASRPEPHCRPEQPEQARCPPAAQCWLLPAWHRQLA